MTICEIDHRVVTPRELAEVVADWPDKWIRAAFDRFAEDITDSRIGRELAHAARRAERQQRVTAVIKRWRDDATATERAWMIEARGRAFGRVLNPGRVE